MWGISVRPSFFNLLFTVIEIVGGVLTNSVAILSDAVHDLGDSFSLGLSLVLSEDCQTFREPGIYLTDTGDFP